MGIHMPVKPCDVAENVCVNTSLWFPVIRISDRVLGTFEIIGPESSWQYFNERPVWAIL